MSELTITEGPGSGTRIRLSAEQAYTIGADANDSIQVTGVGVARRHVVIKALKAGGFGIKGLGGSFVHNGRVIAATKVARLSDGDRIEIGDCVLEFGPPLPGPENGAASDAEPEPIARELGGFRLLEVLGKGGMGVVYRAEQKSLGREVAVKVLSHELTEDPVFVARFVAEARAAARLHHPNVVQVFDVDHVDETYFYSMELMHQGSLEQRLRARGKLPVDEALDVIRDAASGLAFAESLRIVHRDIKPDNLMLDQHGHVKIADLGLALSDEDDTSKLIGTPHFMSPEQIQRAPLDHRSDLYALGCTFYRLVTGQAPFKRTSVKEILRAHLKDEAQPAHKVDPAVPAEISAVIARLLAKNPDERYQSATALIAALDELRAPPSRKGVLIGSIATAVLVAGSAVWWAATRPDPAEPNTITIIQEDPNAEATRLAKLEADAEAAYYRVQADRLDEIAKAEALEAMADAHTDTKFGARAATEAQQIRTRVAQQRAAAAARATAVASACGALAEAFGSALSAGDFARADEVLSLSSIDESLRTATEVGEAREDMRVRLGEAGRERLAALQRTVDDAVAGRDHDAVAAGIASIEAVLSGDSAWPDTAVGDRGAVERYIADARIHLSAIAAEAAARFERDAWNRAATALRPGGDITAAARTFQFDRGARRAEETARTLEGSSAAQRLIAIAAAMRAAARFFGDFETGIKQGRVRVLDPDSGETVEAVRFDRDTGLTVKANRSEKTIPITTVHARRADMFVVAGVPPDDPNRAAFLALSAIAEQVEATTAYLGTIDPAQDDSGVGHYPAVVGMISDATAASLRSAQHDWAPALTAEADASRLASRALMAFSARRNSAAADLLDRLVAEHADTLVVRALQ